MVNDFSVLPKCFVFMKNNFKKTIRKMNSNLVMSSDYFHDVILEKTKVASLKCTLLEYFISSIT